MSGIDNLVSHIENNQSQKDGIISGAEWQLVAKVLGESSYEEGETFSKQDIKKLDKEQQQQAKKDNAVEKNNKEYNNSLKKAQEVLNNPEHVKQLLHICEVQAKLINSTDIKYYQSFLNSIPVLLQADDTIKQSIDGIQKTLEEKEKKKITLDLSQTTSTVNSIDFQDMAKEFEEISPKINEFTNNIHGSDLLESDFYEKLKNSSEEIKSMNDFFINLNDGLVTGKLNVKDLDHGMISGVGVMQLRDLGKTKQERIKNINKSFPFNIENLEKLNNEQLNNDSLKVLIENFIVLIKPFLDALADPNSQLSLYIDHIAEPLAQQINGTLDYSNLESDQSKKAILNIFHRNPIEFNHLRNDFNSADQTKKDNAEKVITTYYKITTGKDLPEGVKVEFVSDMVIQPEVKDATGKIITPKIEKPGFKFKNADGTFVKGVDKGDTVVYFGEEKTGNGQNFEQLLGANGPQWAKDLYKVKDGTAQLDTKTVADLAQQVNFESGPKLATLSPDQQKKVYGSMSEAILDHPLLKELRKAFLTLSGMISGDGKAAVQLNYLNAVDAMKSVWDTERSKPQYSDYKDKDSKWLEEQVKKYPFSLKDDPTDDVAKLSQDAPGSEKHFFASVLTPEEQIAYILDPVERNKYKEGGNIQKIKLTDFIESNGAVQIRDKPTNTISGDNSQETKSTEQPTQGKEFKDGVLYPELSIDGKLPGKVELKDKNTDTPYLMVDGQPVVLTASADPTIKEGILFVKDGAKNAFVQTTIKIDKNNNLSVHVGENSIALDSSGNSNIANVYDKDVLKFPILSGNKNIFEYFAFAKSVITTKSNKIDAVYNAIPENDVAAREEFGKTIVSIQEKISLLKENELSAQNIQKIILDAKVGDICLSNDNQEPQFKLAIKNWLSIFGIKNTDKELA